MSYNKIKFGSLPRTVPKLEYIYNQKNLFSYLLVRDIMFFIFLHDKIGEDYRLLLTAWRGAVNIDVCINACRFLLR